MISFFGKNKKVSAETSTSTGSPKGQTILIVDDSPTEVHVLRKVLEAEGYKIEVAADGQQGVETACTLMPDLILMDVVMPVLNGFQATRQLSKNADTANIPVIMVTTKDQETDRNWAKRQGAVNYVVKPISADELLGKVAEALGG
ncbi:MAG: response regulator [Candidatus Polarisedimenticolaceae bacterium]|nr:response regulator [Candidatus Polarisedimenticolaceae bacterium]